MAGLDDIEYIEYINGRWHLDNNLINGLTITSDDAKIWYKDGKYHRDDGPAFEYPNGDYIYFINGDKHRKDGPAEYLDNGKHQAYYVNNLPHRLDGPAIINNGYEGWYFEGSRISCKSQEEFERMVKLRMFL